MDAPVFLPHDAAGAQLFRAPFEELGASGAPRARSQYQPAKTKNFTEGIETGATCERGTSEHTPKREKPRDYAHSERPRGFRAALSCLIRPHGCGRFRLGAMDGDFF